jgi:porin
MPIAAIRNSRARTKILFLKNNLVHKVRNFMGICSKTHDFSMTCRSIKKRDDRDPRCTSELEAFQSVETGLYAQRGRSYSCPAFPGKSRHARPKMRPDQAKLPARPSGLAKGRSWIRPFSLAAACATLLGLFATAALADDAPPSILNSIPTFADAAAVKKQLADLGVTVQPTYIGETLADVAGGGRQGAIYEGRFEVILEADMAKIANWQGMTLHADGYWIHGTGLSRYYVLNSLTVSDIEALPTVRLYELWAEQKLADNKLALRAGLLGADSDFAVSRYALLFVDGPLGWPDLYSHDLPSGGPAYPFSAMGFRAKYDFSDKFSLLAAIYDGNPAGNGSADPQRRNPYGLAFRMSDPPLLMQEGQFNYNQDRNAPGLAGTIKLGAWQYLGNVADYRLDPLGISYNMTGSQPFNLPGDYGVYAMIDQQALKAPGDPSKGVGLFARVFSAPSARNLIDFYADGGVNVTGFVPGRPDDAFGLAFAYSKISNSVRDAAMTAALPVLPSSELMFELTYQTRIMPGWTAQPVAEYVVRPGQGLGGVLLPNAVVVGLRTTLTF